MTDPTLPPGLAFVRTTPEFDADSVPPGLLREHRIADGVWGVLRVLEGSVRFVLEDTGVGVDLVAGAQRVIEPGVAHHVEPSTGARFEIDFYR